MYNEDRKELMDEGYTEALDAFKLMVEKKVNDLLTKCQTPSENNALLEAQIVILNELEKEMDEL